MAKSRNQKLKSLLANMQPRPELLEAASIPKPDIVNRQGHEAYSLDKWLRLLTILNTSKLEDQFYRSKDETIKELKSLIDVCAKEDPYFTAQCIVYSRCVGEGMRSINNLAASYLAPYCAGKDWAKRFYGLWNKKTQSGGVVFRPDDMSEIIAYFSAMNKVVATNAMKKGFRSALEGLDAYSLLKYKHSLIDVINLVHPNPKKSKAKVNINGENIPVLDAIIKGLSVSADTWEVAQSEAGQEVAKAVREGKIDEEEAQKILKEAKAENWDSLLSDGRLGILAALRNIRNILKTVTKQETIDKLCLLLSDKKAIREGKIMPYQIDLAHEVVISEFNSSNSRRVAQALLSGYDAAIPNLKEMLPGNNLVMVDFSGSMGTLIVDPRRKIKYKSSCLDKAALITATIAKATNADIIRFGSSAEYVEYNPNADVFSIAKSIKKNMGGTSLSAAWEEAKKSGRKYDRVFILSDNECNRSSTYSSYMDYVKSVGSPYVYSVDLAAYGTAAIAGDKVRYYYGYGYSMFEDIAISEFDPNYHLEKVKQIII